MLLEYLLLIEEVSHIQPLNIKAEESSLRSLGHSLVTPAGSNYVIITLLPLVVSD